jgi:glycosyltransferase involved in cell wall biosynthesis
MKSPPVSVVILTQDEEASIAACLDSVADFDDVSVLDSGSKDRTVDIVRGRGLAVYHHPFEGFGRQRNWAIENIPARYPWQFHLDADERVTPELCDELTRTLAADPDVGGYLVPSKLFFAGRWLRHAGSYPVYQVRLFHRDRLRFIDHGHGQREQTSHPLGRLTQPYLHFAFAKGLDHWFAKHALYARREAEQMVRGGPGRPAEPGRAESAARPAAPAGGLFSRDPTSRRRALKRLTARLPGRYFFRLAYMLLVKRAFLDGAAGITYAHMLATYEAMIEVHLRLLRHGLTP